MLSYCRFFVACLILHFIVSVHSAKILSIAFFSSKSHKLTYLPLLEELGKRHEVTLVTPVPPLSESQTNVKEVQTLDLEKFKNDLVKSFNPFEPKTTVSSNPFLLLDYFEDICRQSYILPQVQAVMKQKYDLILLEPTFNECLLGLAHKLEAPLVLWSPVGVPGYLVEKTGGHFPPAVIANIFLGFSNEMSFTQRFVNFGANLAIEALLKFFYEPRMTEVYREMLNDSDIPNVADVISGQTALILSNGHFSLHHPKPLYPSVVEVAPIHSRPAKPLSKDLEEFIANGGDHGFIYFSMGSGLKISQMPEEKLKMFLTVFSKLKQQVLMKWETDNEMPDFLPKNVKLSKWFPQQDLLGHSKIKMFITHCGGGSTEEAIYHNCPVLGIPMFGDQPLNAKLMQSHGFIVELSWDTITEESLMSGIQEILSNPKYKNNVKKLSAIFKDQPDPPLNRAVFWMEYIIRHKGAPHLRSPGRKLNVFQYHSYDVIACYFVAILAILYLIYVVFKTMLIKVIKCVQGGKSEGTKVGNKNKKTE